MIEKHRTFISGFDSISKGGLPVGRTTLVSGTAGSAKTVFAAQFLARGIIEADEPGVFVTFEEVPDHIRKNMAGFGWDIAKWEKEGNWAFVDVSRDPNLEILDVGDFDLGGLLVRIEHAINKTKAKRLAMDSLGAIFSQYQGANVIRREMMRITNAVREMGVTAIMTAERDEEYGDIARYGVEDFVADNVIVLRNVLELEKRRRTVEILKFRGTNHQRGEYPFTIVSGQGIVCIPLSAIELKQASTNVRITSGVPELDEMCGEGFFRDSVILVSGATGTGKTLVVTSFMDGGAQNNERCLLFAFEESREQLLRNAAGWGVDFEGMEEAGKLKIVCEYPESMSLEDLLIMMKDTINEYQPHRLAVDSLSALERVSNVRGFREFVISLTSEIKARQIAGLFTATTPTLTGGTSITEGHISTITDSIILLRYVEINGEMRRGLTVLKMRGSYHDKEIREFDIDGNGLHIGEAFRNVVGILAGNPHHVEESEVKRIAGMFEQEGPVQD